MLSADTESMRRFLNKFKILAAVAAICAVSQAAAQDLSGPEQTVAVRADLRGAENGFFFVQLASLRTEERARKELAELRDDQRLELRNQNFMVQRADLGSRGIYYRVLVGPYLSRFVASAYCSEIQSAGQDCMVLRRKSYESP